MIATARLINYIHSLRSYVTKQPGSVITVTPSASDYKKVFRDFAKIVLNDDSEDVDSPPSPPLQTQTVIHNHAQSMRKRKYSSSTLVSVEELVRKIVPGIQWYYLDNAVVNSL